MGARLDCPFCWGFLHLLGILGRFLHFRCRDCGMEVTRRGTADEISRAREELGS